MNRRNRQILFVLISMLVSAGILLYLFQHITINEVTSIISDADKGGILMFLVFSFGMSFFRTWRYLLLLSVSGFSPPKVALFLVVLVRNLFSDLLPSRIGTLIYVALVSTRLGVAVDAALSSWAYSLVFDLIAIAPLIIIASIALALGLVGSEMVSLWLLFFGGIFLAVIFSLLAKFLPQCFSLAVLVIKRLSGDSTGQNEKLGSIGKYATEFAKKLSDTRQEIIRTQNSGILGRVLLLSVLVRLCKYAGLYFFLYALLLPMGFGFKELDPIKSFLGICAAELSASLPISGIAGFGLYQGAWSMVFEVLLLPAKLAKLTSVSHHLFTQVYGYSIGALALILLALPFFKVQNSMLTKQPVSQRSSKFFLIKLATSVATLGLVLFCVYYATSVEARAKFNNEQIILSETEKEALRNLGNNLKGLVLFDSNRSGSFGIYTMHFDGTNIEQIIDGPKHEMYPDPSPDGRYITYALTPSLQRIAPAKVFIYDITAKKSKLVSKDGNYPSFSADGKYIYYTRERKELYRYSLEEKSELLIFPLDKNILGRYQLVHPRVSSNGEKACFTSDKMGNWNVWCANIKEQTLEHIGHGCQPSWSTVSEIVWVGTSGVKERSAIMQSKLGKSRDKVLVDKDAPWGHEYFPSMLESGSHLLYSACPPDQHSHTDSNYQLFAFETSTGATTRLTFDGFTNRWPKLLKVGE